MWFILWQRPNLCSLQNKKHVVSLCPYKRSQAFHPFFKLFTWKTKEKSSLLGRVVLGTVYGLTRWGPVCLSVCQAVVSQNGYSQVNTLWHPRGKKTCKAVAEGWPRGWSGRHTGCSWSSLRKSSRRRPQASRHPPRAEGFLVTRVPAGGYMQRVRPDVDIYICIQTS